MPPGLDCASGSVVTARFNWLVPRSAGPRVCELSSAGGAEFRHRINSVSRCAGCYEIALDGCISSAAVATLGRG